MRLTSFFYRVIFPALILTSPLVARSADKVTATVLTFEEKETVTDVYKTRMLINRQFMRIDDGEGSQDFALMDRRKKIIYSVSSEEKSILVIVKTAITGKTPHQFQNTVEKVKGTYPDVSNKSVSHYRLLTNGKQCMDLYSAKELLSAELAALREFQTILAGEHGSILDTIPKDMQNDCDLVNNIFFPNRHLQFGFPVRQEDMVGKYRQLIDFKEGSVLDAALFTLPKDYSRFSSKDMRSAMSQ